MRFALAALAFLTLVSCNQGSSSPVEPSIFRSWKNTNVLDENDIPVTARLTFSGTLSNAKMQLGWIDGFSQNTVVCECEVALSGTTLTGIYTYSACTQKGTHGSSCSQLNGLSNSYETDGSTYLTMSANPADRWTLY